MKRRQAYHLIKAAAVVSNLKNVHHGAKCPNQRAPSTPPYRLKPEQQREVWVEAVRTAPKGKVTASHVERTVKNYRREKMHRQRTSKEDQRKYHPGEFVWICTRYDAESLQKGHNGCWGVVTSVTCLALRWR